MLTWGGHSGLCNAFKHAKRGTHADYPPSMRFNLNAALSYGGICCMRPPKLAFLEQAQNTLWTCTLYGRSESSSLYARECTKYRFSGVLWCL